MWTWHAILSDTHLPSCCLSGSGLNEDRAHALGHELRMGEEGQRAVPHLNTLVQGECPWHGFRCRCLVWRRGVGRTCFTPAGVRATRFSPSKTSLGRPEMVQGGGEAEDQVQST